MTGNKGACLRQGCTAQVTYHGMHGGPVLTVMTNGNDDNNDDDCKRKSFRPLALLMQRSKILAAVLNITVSNITNIWLAVLGVAIYLFSA